MTRRPRMFPSDLPPRERRVYRAATVFFVALFVALIWPVYPVFSGIRPFVLGVPLSLAYVVCLLLLGFGVLLGLFAWEGRRLDRDGRRVDPAGRGSGPEGPGVDPGSHGLGLDGRGRSGGDG